MTRREPRQLLVFWWVKLSFSNTGTCREKLGPLCSFWTTWAHAKRSDCEMKPSRRFFDCQCSRHGVKHLSGHTDFKISTRIFKACSMIPCQLCVNANACEVFSFSLFGRGSVKSSFTFGVKTKHDTIMTQPIFSYMLSRS